MSALPSPSKSAEVATDGLRPVSIVDELLNGLLQTAAERDKDTEAYVLEIDVDECGPSTVACLFFYEVSPFAAGKWRAINDITTV